jgi:hypothetical protein
LELIDGQDHLGLKIDNPDSPGILSKFLSVEVRQEKSSTIDGRVDQIGKSLVWSFTNENHRWVDGRVSTKL